MDHQTVVAVSITGTCFDALGSLYLAYDLLRGQHGPLQFNRAACGLNHYSLFWEGLFAAIRGAAFGAGLYRILRLRFAIAFAVLITVGQNFTAKAGRELRWRSSRMLE
jgi:hypothetical protein